ncbi:glycosyl hydrolase family 10 (plasmid) [Azospirillum argentinense]|uniref:Beta-xylanase n=1 Tax=Azospirillum argentinense TaxID=2970906 RepID=A0A4D8PLQ1_9PROT|nr:endo-1,4-beta-xylanase [Azospirillum argentinense]QCN97407.1 glycosyl hydrolase family 10 [Azospirillum argentinense]
MRTQRIGRRDLLAGLGVGLGVAGLAGGLMAQPEPIGLRAIAATRGIAYGAALGLRSVTEEPALAEAYARECAVLVPEGDAKWTGLHPASGVFRFDGLDRLLEIAVRHGQCVRGHTLLWHEALPEWVRDALPNGRIFELLTDHIFTVLGRYRGRIPVWDVVNEAVEPEDGREDGLRQTPWLSALGPRCLDLAFKAARAADPAALLMLNEHDLEYASPLQDRRRRAVLRLLETLLARGVPVDGLGMQSHLRIGRPFDARILHRFVGEVTDLGLTVMITELDVGDAAVTGDIATRDRAVADHARAYLDTVLDHACVKAVTSWGLSDRQSWLHHHPAGWRADGQPMRPLPLDTDLRPKPLWQALADAFRAAPARTPPAWIPG